MVSFTLFNWSKHGIERRIAPRLHSSLLDLTVELAIRVRLPTLQVLSTECSVVVFVFQPRLLQHLLNSHRNDVPLLPHAKLLQVSEVEAEFFVEMTREETRRFHLILSSVMLTLFQVLSFFGWKLIAIVW